MKFPARINIALSLNPELEIAIRYLNKQIVAHGFSEISFQHGSPHIPHITLLMGEVANETDYDQLVMQCHNFARDQVPFRYQISEPYLKEPARNFIFIDTTPQQVFREFKRALHQAVGQFLKCEYHGGPDNASHVTIGYAKPVYPYLDLLRKEFRMIDSSAVQMQVFVAGNRGTCVKMLETIHIGSKQLSQVEANRGVKRVENLENGVRVQQPDR